MGSGIVTAYNVIRRHGGEFTIESALGKGTTVTIQLPLIVRPA
jgi:signal transduction histidine kinase